MLTDFSLYKLIVIKNSNFSTVVQIFFIFVSVANVVVSYSFKKRSIIPGQHFVLQKSENVITF